MSVTPIGRRRKGSEWERQIVLYLACHGFPFAERAYGAGRPDDKGDIDGIPGWTLEAKNHKTLDLAGWTDEAAAEARRNTGAKWWAVIAKRRNRPVGQAYVIMSLEQFAALLADEPEPTNSMGWDGIVRGPVGYPFFCSVCQSRQTVPHDTKTCGPPA